ncbi:hypothetical protein CVT25_004841 [Psilocybe cyanescens]|uniref:Uncharacterized protein n=1 Tax=Psilocybe cyanescens TaxID=93625 RepID=A0A409XGL6_PSICY|nr:hypothetical protein CVT25_004841 [Psilocybe cyanescens]
MAVNWYYTQVVFIDNGDTRANSFIASIEDGKPWIFIVSDILDFSVFILSDGLLIWRCYHVWGKSRRVLAVLLVFMLAEVGLFVAVVTFTVLLNSLVREEEANLANHIRSAQIFISLTTTIITTVLLAYKIHTASSRVISRSKGVFRHAAVVLVESAAAYSFVILIYAVFGVIPSTNFVGSANYNTTDYMGMVVNIVGGVAPTILVARIVLTDPKDTVAPTITHISGIHFQSEHGTNQGTSADGGDVIVDVTVSEIYNAVRQDEEKQTK